MKQVKFLAFTSRQTAAARNHRFNQDIFVRDDYKGLLNGRDRQLEAAVNEGLKEIKK